MNAEERVKVLREALERAVEAEKAAGVPSHARWCFQSALRPERPCCCWIPQARAALAATSAQEPEAVLGRCGRLLPEVREVACTLERGHVGACARPLGGEE